MIPTHPLERSAVQACTPRLQEPFTSRGDKRGAACVRQASCTRANRFWWVRQPWAFAGLRVLSGPMGAAAMGDEGEWRGVTCAGDGGSNRCGDGGSDGRQRQRWATNRVWGFGPPTGRCRALAPWQANGISATREALAPHRQYDRCRALASWQATMSQRHVGIPPPTGNRFSNG